MKSQGIHDVRALSVILVICAFLFDFGESVPPSPSSRMWEDLSAIKGTLHTISGDVDRWNSLYIKQLEPRLLSTAIILANVDTNLKNLQERAHVWDTFQLHVSAWNEQLSTLDRKVDILSKGQEKLLQLDNKYSSMSNVDYKLDEILKRVEANENLLNAIDKRVDVKKIEHDSLLSEFTTRGMLSTLKIIERKLDRLQALSNTMLNKQNNLMKKNVSANKNPNAENNGKFVIKCNTPPKVEEILNDVSSKVDVIFDKFEKITEDRYGDRRDLIEEGFLENQTEGSGDALIEVKSSGTDDYTLFKNILKRINQPCKKSNRMLDVLEQHLERVDNNTYAILNRLNGLNCQQSEQPNAKFNNNLVNEIVNISNAQMEKYFKEQENTYYRICGNLSIKEETVLTRPEARGAEESDSETHGGIVSVDENIYVNETACEFLEPNHPSKVYLLGEDRKLNEKRRDFTERFCENGWTVIQRRGYQTEGSQKAPVNFNASWYDYKTGFGSLVGDFWFGNNFIHELSKNRDCVLRIELHSFEGSWAWAEFREFSLADEGENYRIRVGNYVGNASDSLSSHSGSMFSTYDKTNDLAPECCPCAASYGGGWWFNSCFESNLNGIYYQHPNTGDYFKGIVWEHWLGNYSLKKSKIMIKPLISYENTTSQVEYKTSTTDRNVVYIPEDP